MSVRLRGLALALLPWSDVFYESPAHRPVWAYLWVNLHQSFWHRLQLPVSHSVTLSNALWFWWPNLVSTSFFLVLPPGFMLWYASWGDAGRGDHLFIWEWKVTCTPMSELHSSPVWWTSGFLEITHRSMGGCKAATTLKSLIHSTRNSRKAASL